MAPVSIPRLQKVSTAQQPRGDRLNIQVKDQSKLIQETVGGAADLVGQGAELYMDIEDDKIQQMSQENELEYKAWNNQKLNELRSIKGDPTDAYAQYELDEKEKSEAILNKRPDISARAKEKIGGNFSRSQANQRVQTLNQRGLQQETYANNLYETTLKSKQDDLPSSASHIRKGDLGSSFAFDQKIGEVIDTVTKRGLKTGTVTKRKDGTIQHSALSQARIRKEVGSGVTNSVKILIDSGYHEEAEALREKYKGYIGGKDQVALEKKFGTDRVQREAYDLINSFENPDAMAKGIRDMDEGPVKTQAQKLQTTQNARITADRKFKEDKNYELIDKEMSRLDKDGSLHGIADIENNKVYKATYDNLSSKQQRAIDERFNAPKVDSQEVLTEYYDVLLGNHPTLKPETMTGAQISELGVGLSKSTKAQMSGKILTRQGKSLNISNSVYKKATGLMRTKLYAEELIKNDQYGNLKKKDFVKLNKANEALTDYMEELPANATIQQISQHVDEFIKEKKKDELFKNTSWYSGWFSNDDEENTAQGKSTKKKLVNPIKDLDNKEVSRLLIDYKRSTGADTFPSPTDPDFLEYARTKQ